MDIEKVKSAQSQEEARDYAIQWQHWVWQHWVSQEETFSINDLIIWQEVFELLAEKFDLEEEFKENGII